MSEEATMEGHRPAESLEEALQRYGIFVPDEAVPLLNDYCRDLWEWNEKLNLTRHTNYDLFVSRDLYDSCMLAQLLLPGEKVLDLGSGGGVPAVILAILRPDLTVTASESIGKKARALQDIVRRLLLPVRVHAGRGEELLERERYDVVTARAVGPMVKVLRWLQPHWDAIGRLLLVKGPRWEEERKEARHRGLLRTLELRRAAVYQVPHTGARSFVLMLWPKGQEEPGPRLPTRKL